MRIKNYFFYLLLSVLALGACREEERFQITFNDSEPPQNPIFVDSEPLAGGARVYYLIPSDEDLLYIEASYKNTVGKEVCAISSYFTDHVDVVGFLDAGEHDIILKSVDRAGNKSSGIKAVVESNEAPITTVSNTVEILPSFGSYLVRWQDPEFIPLYVSLKTEYNQGGEKRSFVTEFATAQSETKTISNLPLRNGEEVSVIASVRDKYDNEITLPVNSIVLLVDSPLDKSTWTLPEPGTMMGGVAQFNGNVERGEMAFLYDGITEADGEINYCQTDSEEPWNVIVDLGAQYNISRILTHQRYSGSLDLTTNNVQGAYYRDDNVLAYNLYIWDETSSSWLFIRRHDIAIPVVRDVREYKTLGDAGDEAFLYPEEPKFSASTRYFRLEAINGKVMSELTIFGQPAQ